jgi:NADPH2:quinone reductase
MRALRIEKAGGPEVMQIVDVPVPEPGKGRVRVKVEACGLNYSDIMIREGQYIDATTFPYFLGREFCGTVDKIGEGVQGWSIGQSVVGSAMSGAMSEYVIVQPQTLIPCPEGLTPVQGAALLVAGITAMHCLEDCARLQAGETVLIHAAAGGVGSLAIQIARNIGAMVMGTASTPEKCALITDLGATAIDYTRGDWVKEVRSVTDGKGADVILDSVGGEVFSKSFREALAPFGRLVVLGVASRDIVEISNREILESNRTITGYYLGAYFPEYLGRVVTATMRLVSLIQEGKIKPIVGKTFPLERAAEAFNHMQMRQNVGKVIIVP